MKITQKCLIWILTLKYGKNCILSFLCRFLAGKFKRFSCTSISKTEKKITFFKLYHLNFDVQKKRQNYLFQFLNIYFRRENSNTFSEKKMKIWLLLWQLIIFQIDIEIQLQFLGTLRNVYLARWNLMMLFKAHFCSKNH